MKKVILALSALFLFSACASLRSVSLTSIPKQRSRKIEAQSSKWIIFGLSFDNDYADQVTMELKDRCNNGMVRGILTKDENFNYFIGIVMKRQITATGYCLKG